MTRTIRIVFAALLFGLSSVPAAGQEIGTASVWEAFFFLLGIGLIAVEFFLTPGVAVFALAVV